MYFLHLLCSSSSFLRHGSSFPIMDNKLYEKFLMLQNLSLIHFCVRNEAEQQKMNHIEWTKKNFRFNITDVEKEFKISEYLPAKHYSSGLYTRCFFYGFLSNKTFNLFSFNRILRANLLLNKWLRWNIIPICTTNDTGYNTIFMKIFLVKFNDGSRSMIFKFNKCFYIHKVCI